jgi:hypothetical protein
VSVAPDAPVPPKLKEELDWVSQDDDVIPIAPLFSTRSSPAPPEMPVASVTAPDVEPASEEPKTTVALALLVRDDDADMVRLPSLRMKSDPSPPEIPVDRVIAASVPPVFPVPPKLKEELSCVIVAVAVTAIEEVLWMPSAPVPPSIPAASVRALDVEPACDDPKMTMDFDLLERVEVAVTSTAPSLRMPSFPSPPETPVDRVIASSVPPASPVPAKLKEELSRDIEATDFAVIVEAFVMQSLPAPPPMPRASVTAPAFTEPLEAPKMTTESASTEL